MLQGLKNIKYYLICMLLAFGLYTYGAISGTLLFGDDNLNTDGHAVNATGGHYYGHGYFFHK